MLLAITLACAMLLSLIPHTPDRDLTVPEPAITMYQGPLATASRTNLRPLGSAWGPGKMQQKLVEPVTGIESMQPAASWWPIQLPSVANRGRLGIPSAEYDHDALMGPGNNIQYPGEYPDTAFIEDVRKRFPQEGIADTFQARALLAEGYTWLDVRTSFEYDEGHVPDSVNIPIITSTGRRFDSSVGDRVYVNQKINTDFTKEVEKRFPDKNAKIIVGCSDGRKRSIMALETLEKAGFTHLVGLKGGFFFWQTKYDGKLRRRREEKQTEVYNARGDASGIHGVAAGNFDFGRSGMGIPGDVTLVDSQKWETSPVA